MDRRRSQAKKHKASSIVPTGKKRRKAKSHVEGREGEAMQRKVGSKKICRTEGEDRMSRRTSEKDEGWTADNEEWMRNRPGFVRLFQIYPANLHSAQSILFFQPCRWLNSPTLLSLLSLPKIHKPVALFPCDFARPRGPMRQVATLHCRFIPNRTSTLW